MTMGELDAMLDAERKVRTALGAYRGESMDDAARRILRDAMPSIAREVATEILHGRGEPWAVVFRAASLVRPRLVR